MMISLRIGFLCGLIAVLGMGCATTVNPTAQSFGRSYRQMVASQTLHPAARENLKSVEKFHGGAAQLAMDRYRRSFQDVPTQQQFILRTGEIER